MLRFWTILVKALRAVSGKCGERAKRISFPRHARALIGGSPMASGKGTAHVACAPARARERPNHLAHRHARHPSDCARPRGWKAFALPVARDSTAAGNGDGNYGRYSNPDLDALIDKARVETDPAKRDAHLRDAQLLLNREIPLLPLHQSVIPWAMKNNVTARFPPNPVPYFFRFRIE
jgi:hypothetical protein